MKEIMVGEVHKFEIEEVGEKCIIATFFEKMGCRWVKIGDPERWDKESFEECYELKI